MGVIANLGKVYASSIRDTTREQNTETNRVHVDTKYDLVAEITGHIMVDLGALTYVVRECSHGRYTHSFSWMRPLVRQRYAVPVLVTGGLAAKFVPTVGIICALLAHK
jgi:hypothetical protein